MLPPLYRTDDGYAIGRWVVQWDKNKYYFKGFYPAKTFLLDQLWWLAEDLHHEPTFQAWFTVLEWVFEDGMEFSVQAGDPPSTYHLKRTFEEEGEDE